MRLLLDTSVMIKIGLMPESLNVKLRNAISEADSILVTSVARAEIGIKVSIGKLQLPVEEKIYWRAMSSRLQAQELAFNCAHAARLADLPLLHRDPFDRMIAAQCIDEDIYLASTDPIFEQYGVKLVS